MESVKCPGFTAGGVAAGLKKNGKDDLGLIFSEVPASAAGVFTRNRVQAAPVLLDRERIQSGLCQAIIVNSGNANCCTGDRGMKDARNMAKSAASALGISEDLVLVASTGVIGKPLAIDKVEKAIPGLVRSLSANGIDEVARAIMTTDTRPKAVSVSGSLQGKPFTITGIAKGSGMIRPDMATMLCFVCTDVSVDSGVLSKVLSIAAEKSFNRITIDGDTSTNDTVLLLANGASGDSVGTPQEIKTFQGILDEVFIDLAKELVRDGEGVTKLVEIQVKGAVSDTDARAIADTVAHSNLVKTAFFGEDANWGRIMGAAGRAGVPIDPGNMDIWFDRVRMVENGEGCGDKVEAEATEVLKKPEYAVLVDLKTGQGRASVLTCDFSVDYVKINADYRS